MATGGDGDVSMAEAVPPLEGEDPAVNEPEEMPELSLDILDIIKTAQSQHGLRHGDYGRYRQYCSRRLQRLRKSVGFTHGKGRYAKRPLEPASVRDMRHLMLPLFCAERAWAYAMQLKRENTQQEPRPHHHLLARLAKAAAWSEKLAGLCAARTDQRTELEAKAYAAFMEGYLRLEREHWAPALSCFRSCETICTELSRVSMAEQAHLYSQMVAEVEPSLRFCAYNLRRLGGGGGGEGGGGAGGDGGGSVPVSMESHDVEGLAGAEGTSDILRSKLEQVLAETRAKQAENVTELIVLGERVPIKSAKTKLCILRGQQLLGEVEEAERQAAAKADGGAEPVGAAGGVEAAGAEAAVEGAEAGGEAGAAGEDTMTVYDQLFVAFNDALDSVRSDLHAVSREHTAKSGVAESNLRKLQAGLQWQKLHHTARRTLALVQRLRQGKGPAGSRKRATAEDLVRLYDAVISTLDEMRQLDGYKESERLVGQVAARAAIAKAYRCYYVAESYAAAEKWREALVLFDRATQLMVEANHLYDDDSAADNGPASLVLGADRGGFGPGEDGAALERLDAMVEGAKARASAKALLARLAPPAATGTPPPAAAPLPLLQRLDRFDARPDEPLIAFPPKLEAVPCKPLLFDIARNQIQFPDLQQRLQKHQGSKWGSWFSR